MTDAVHAKPEVLKAVIFDLDGVLVDTAIFHFEAWKRLANELGIPFEASHNEALKGVSRRDSLEKILALGSVSLSEADKEMWMQRKNDWYLQLVATLQPGDLLPGAEKLLTSLRNAGIRIGLGSSSRNARLILDKLNIAHFFDAVVDGNDIEHSKPHPEVFTRCAERLGVDPASGLVIEDAASGAEAAKAGGFYCVGIGNIPGADHCIVSLNEVTPASLDKLLQTSTRII